MTTDLTIRGVRYDLEDTLSNPKLNVLVHMNKRIGVTIGQIRGLLKTMNVRYRAAAAARDRGDEGAPDDEDVVFDMLSDDGLLDAWRGLIWLSRAQAGERGPDGKFLTLDDANDGIGFRDFAFVNDEPAESDADEDTPDATSSKDPRPVRALGKDEQAPAA